MFARNKGSKGIRKKQLDNPEPKLRFKSNGMRNKRETQHGDYKTTYSNGITYHQSKGKINYGTSRGHKSNETCLICE